MLIDTMENIWFRQHSHVCDVARLEHEDNFTGYMHDEKMHMEIRLWSKTLKSTCESRGRAQGLLKF